MMDVCGGRRVCSFFMRLIKRHAESPSGTIPTQLPFINTFVQTPLKSKNFEKSNSILGIFSIARRMYILSKLGEISEIREKFFTIPAELPSGVSEGQTNPICVG